MTWLKRSPILKLAAPLVLAGTILVPTAVIAAPRAAAPTWATYNPATHVAHLQIISSYGGQEFNFNGGTNGQLKVKVPLNSKVVVTYSNQSAQMPHGFEVVQYTGTLPMSTVPTPAFVGAMSPNFRHGTPAGATQTITFTASKAGKYLLICPVHNHVKFGHWAWLIVSTTARTATAAVK